MKKRILLSLVAVVLLLSIFLAGCKELSGVAQETYDRVVAELKDAQARYTDALTKYDELQTEKAAVEAQLQEARATIARLQSQLSESGLTGATPAETAEKIVKYYHETHIYSSYDLFVCSDMASEVWNMLKAQGIASVIVVGNKDAAIGDILQSNHAWVLAEVTPGKYLALETTGGHSVPVSQNPLYYRGWSFGSPADLKSYQTLVQEYNVRVGLRNTLASEMNEAHGVNNTLYEKLKELKVEQEAILNDIKAQINSLATVLL
jgi:predicted nuclease with TOPRIM domain